MAIRVTQNTMYNNMVGSMQKNLGAYMESVEQGASQKKINRPSDDPAGTYRVLTTRVDQTQTAQYQENVDTAKGWLNLADQILSSSVTTAITGLKTLAEQASTGTYTAEQRMIMADQARQYFGQLLNLSNTDYEGKSIFAGHKYDASAFQEGLAATTWDEEWNKLVEGGAISVQGASSRSVLIQFVGDPGKPKELQAGTKYKWSNDGGNTWQEGCEVGVDKQGNFILTPEKTDPPTGETIGVEMKIDTEKARQILGTGEESKIMFTGADPEKSPGLKNGTTIFLRPAAYYQGDDNDPPAQITYMGAEGVTAEATGEFGKNILVRMDSAVDTNIDLSVEPPKDPDFTWSYSTDGGNTWVPAKGKVSAFLNPDGDLRLPIPGGFIDITAPKKTDDTTKDIIPEGAQLMVHPARADLGYEIMKDTYLAVNGVGKDIFGGYYEGRPALSGDDNLFEVAGAFIGYLEGNIQEGCQKALAAFTTAEKKVLAEATRIGGMENRLSMAQDVLSYQKLDQQERLSYVEDVDLTELLTRLTRQQLTYQTVLQSSSMIMKLSLANYV